MTNNFDNTEIPEKYRELLAELRKQDSLNAVDENGGFMQLHTAMRVCLRQILWDLGVPNNPCWGDTEIIESLISNIEKLKKNKNGD